MKTAAGSFTRKSSENLKMDGDVGEATNVEAHEETHRALTCAGWRSLFIFTTKSHFSTLCVALVLSVATGIIIPALAIFLGKIFNSFTAFGAGRVSGSDLVRKVSKDCIALAGLGGASWLLNGAYFMFWLVFGELQAKSVRDKLYDGMLQKDMEWYDMRKDGIGALITRLQAQIKELQIATSQPLGFAAQYTVTTFAALALAFYTAWNLTLVTLATIPVSAVMLSWISAHMQPSIDAQVDGLTQASKFANNAISAIDAVKCFNGQDFELWQYASTIKKAAKFYLVQAQANALQIGLVRIVTLGMFVQGFWYGSHLVATDQKSAGQIATAFWACLVATQAVEQILPQMLVLEKGRAAGATLGAILNQIQHRPSVIKLAGRLTPRYCDGDIEARNVSFVYPSRPNQYAINNASFYFPAGETTFLVGRSGSGKSTVGNLLLGFYDTRSGEVSVDGNMIQTLDIGWLRNNITLVQQQSVLFNETIFKNIAFGRRDYDRVRKEEVKESIEVAFLQSTIRELHKGLDTPVGSGGSTLSGGQKQRVAIARARLRNTPILILDEATSALDHISRIQVMDAIRKWRRGKTTIIITHDISQVQKDDFAYVLDGGVIIQQGYRRVLEQSTTGPFAGNIKPEVDRPELPFSTSPKRLRPQLQPLEITPRPQRHSVLSEDSMNIHFEPGGQYVPTYFSILPDSLQPRRGSEGLISPLSPVAFQMHRMSINTTAQRLSMIPRRASIMSGRNEARRPEPPQLLEPLSPIPFGFTNDVELMDMAGGHDTSNALNSARYIRRRPSIKVPSIRQTIKSPWPIQDTSKRKRKLTADERSRRIAPLKKILTTLWPALTRGERVLLVVGFMCALLHAAATPVFSWIFSKLLATFFLANHRTEAARMWSLSILGVAIGDAIASYYMHYLLELCGQAWVDTLRVEAMKRILDQPRAWFNRDKNKLSRLTECLDRNAEEMRNLVGRFAGFVFVAISMMMMAVFWSLITSWKLTFVGLASAPVMYVITRGFHAISGKWEGKSNHVGDAAGVIFTETFGNIRTVRALTLEGYLHKKYLRATRSALKVGLKRSAYSGLFYGLSDSGIVFITALIFYYGAILVKTHQFSVQDILTVFALLLFSISNANAIIAFIPQVNSSRDTATRLLRLANLPLRRSHEHTGHIRLANPWPIIFRDLTFTYASRPGQIVFSNLNLVIRPNTLTAIVGASGSGKSTIAALLLGLYPPSPHIELAPAMLLIGGHDIRSLHIPSLRNLIALVPQTPVLFPTTISRNISYALPENSLLRTPANIRAAACAAGIDDFIRTLPDGYNTEIGDGGAGLSGGQAQRVVIARALVRRPQIVVLDEATSGLDEESAEVIRQTARRLVEKSGITVLAITHAREMMQCCANVVVLGRGRVVEEGHFENLIRRKEGELRRLLREDGDGERRELVC